MTNMTVEELRMEADKLGYSITQKRKTDTSRSKFMPCLCGRKRTTLFYGNKGYSYGCKKCNVKVMELSATKEDAMLKWNALIESIIKEAV